MVLRIHINKKDLHFEATNLFQIGGIVDYSKLDNLLARVKVWVADPKHYFSLLDRGGIATFKITFNGLKYEFELMDESDDRIPEDVVVAAVEKYSEKKIGEICTRLRHHNIYKPRVLLFAGLRFFSRITTKALERKYGFDHATVLNTGKAIRQFLNSNDDFILKGVQQLASEFNNTHFFDAIYKNQYPRE